jgi:cellobiose-specific phosphotransferase system component IIA
MMTSGLANAKNRILYVALAEQTGRGRTENYINSSQQNIENVHDHQTKLVSDETRYLTPTRLINVCGNIIEMQIQLMFIGHLLIIYWGKLVVVCQNIC